MCVCNSSYHTQVCLRAAMRFSLLAVPAQKNEFVQSNFARIGRMCNCRVDALKKDVSLHFMGVCIFGVIAWRLLFCCKSLAFAGCTSLWNPYATCCPLRYELPEWKGASPQIVAQEVTFLLG